MKTVSGPFVPSRETCVDRCAIITMEECYARVTLEYGNSDYKNRIIEAIESIKKEFPETIPYVIERKIDDENGNFSVEFEHEFENREVGEFIERLVQVLDIGKCG